MELFIKSMLVQIKIEENFYSFYFPKEIVQWNTENLNFLLKMMQNKQKRKEKRKRQPTSKPNK